MRVSSCWLHDVFAAASLLVNCFCRHDSKWTRAELLETSHVFRALGRQKSPTTYLHGAGIAKQLLLSFPWHFVSWRWLTYSLGRTSSCCRVLDAPRIGQWHESKEGIRPSCFLQHLGRSEIIEYVCIWLYMHAHYSLYRQCCLCFFTCSLTGPDSHTTYFKFNSQHCQPPVVPRCPPDAKSAVAEEVRPKACA